MHAVLYTQQMEPITVVDLPIWIWDRLWRGDMIQLEVREPFNFMAATEPLPVTYCPRRVAIFGERLRRREHEALMLFTSDEENALALQAEFLPGQRGTLHDQKRGAFAAGFLRALQEFVA